MGTTEVKYLDCGVWNVKRNSHPGVMIPIGGLGNVQVHLQTTETTTLWDGITGKYVDCISCAVLHAIYTDTSGKTDYFNFTGYSDDGQTDIMVDEFIAKIASWIEKNSLDQYTAQITGAIHYLVTKT
jgi:hypothetical protein